MKNNDKDLQRFHQRIAEKAAENAARTVLIAALGDSVTAGAAAENEFLHDAVYHAQFQHLLEARYPTCVFSTVNAGVGGDNAAGGMKILERDVLHLRPDLLLISFGLNDSVGELAGLDDYKNALIALIERTRAETEADIILLTPNMMPRRDNDKIPARWRHVTELFISLQTEGVLAAYAQAVREVGAQCEVPVADVYAAWEALEACGVDTTAMLSNGLNHPDAAGHKLAAQVLFDTVCEYSEEKNEA